jgi:predicted nuclease of predicted toxin-antitoxin system
MSKIAQLEQQNNNADKKKYELIVSQLQMVNESLFNESYIIVKNNKTGKTWRSPYFYFKMF